MFGSNDGSLIQTEIYPFTKYRLEFLCRVGGSCSLAVGRCVLGQDTGPRTASNGLGSALHGSSPVGVSECVNNRPLPNALEFKLKGWKTFAAFHQQIILNKQDNDGSPPEDIILQLGCFFSSELRTTDVSFPRRIFLGFSTCICLRKSCGVGGNSALCGPDASTWSGSD